jgi:hypothetical protein
LTARRSGPIQVQRNNYRGFTVRLQLVAAFLLISTPVVFGAERPSFMQTGDAFCTNEADFNGFAARGRARANSGTETCRMVAIPTRVAILNGQGGSKTMVRIMSGTNAYEIGWTNGKLPVQ